MRFVLVIVAVNLVLIGAFVAAFQLWPSLLEDEEDSAYVCKKLDNGLDAPRTPVEVCISKTDITDGRFEACKRPPELSEILGRVLIVFDPENDMFCAVAMPQK